jgi:plastocyanin
MAGKPPEGLYRRKTRIGIVAAGFGVFIVAVGLVTLLTWHTVKKNRTNNVAVVRITNNGFQPATLVVRPGTKVVWSNGDQSLHQVTANPFPKGTDLPSLKSEILTNAQEYAYTAHATGSFGYHDQLNPTINGTLIVKN